MSLSQKHSGKILVPWFNKSEWKSVYDLINTGNTECYSKALNILQIWKLRTPLLSAGVEGTLILLEALLLEVTLKSDFEASYIYATSLLRFLNLCATNSNKQGTFHKTAKEHDLPSWIISLRHDIAHSHKLRSKSMLEISLNFCLDWIKSRYWDAEFHSTSDLIILDSPKRSDNLQELISLSTCLNDVCNDPEIDDLIVRIVGKSSKKKDLGFLVKRVTKLLRDCIRNDIRNAVPELCNVIESGAFLDTSYEISHNGRKMIPTLFIQKWSVFLNAVNEARVLIDFVKALSNFVSDINNEMLLREIASLWIRDIFLEVNKAENTCVKFNRHFSIKDEGFVSEVLNNPNEFTTNFLKEVLEYNEAPTLFIEDSFTLLKALTTVNNIQVNGILTVDGLNVDFGKIAKMDIITSVTANTEDTNLGWTVIENITAYKNLPLGILPHQPRHINPVINL